MRTGDTVTLSGIVVGVKQHRVNVGMIIRLCLVAYEQTGVMMEGIPCDGLNLIPGDVVEVRIKATNKTNQRRMTR